MAESQKTESAKGGGKPSLTPEQEAAAASKRAARAEGKAKGGGKGKGAAVGSNLQLATERVKRPSAARLRTAYEKDIRPRLMKELGIENPMEAPRLVKITLNMGLGEAVTNPKVVDNAVEELAMISGQKPVVTRAKKAIANFKLKENQKIGAMVTLRRDHMYEFLDRLITFALPRVRDFKGVAAKAFDGRGNYSLGLKEALIFPDVNVERVDKAKGMNITFTTTARTDEQGRALLRHLGIPFRS